MLVGSIAFVTAGFWMLMIFDCIRHEPTGSRWLWSIFLLNFPGAVVYFAVRKLPDLDLPIPNFFQPWSRKEALWSAEAGVSKIGNAPQYVTLGNVLREMGKLDRALECYSEALVREENNSDAMWGCAKIEIKRKQLHIAMEHLHALFTNEPDYRGGEASLQYGKVLYELAQWSPAQAHLQGDLKRWGHPESLLLLARISVYYDDDRLAARNYLDTLLGRLNAQSRSTDRKHQHLIREAGKLRKTLGQRF
jgi:hypothetical protein